MEGLALKIAAIIFLLVAILHLARLIFKVKITVGNFIVPLRFSILGFIIPLLLSIWLFKSLK